MKQKRQIIIFTDLDGSLLDKNTLPQANALIVQNDNEFKYWLDRYKYADRYPEMTQSEYRQRGEVFLQVLETLLTKNV